MMQTAEEFIGMCEREAYPAPTGVLINTLCIAALLERDNATRLAAKLELLEEIRAEANERDRLNFHDFAFNLNYAFQAAEAKYRADGS